MALKFLSTYLDIRSGKKVPQTPEKDERPATCSNVKVGQQYGNFAERVAELSKKSSEIKTLGIGYEKKNVYFDDKGNIIGTSTAPDIKLGIPGDIQDGKVNYSCKPDGKVYCIFDADTRIGYADWNKDGIVGENERW